MSEVTLSQRAPRQGLQQLSAVERAAWRPLLPQGGVTVSRLAIVPM